MREIPRTHTVSRMVGGGASYHSVEGGCGQSHNLWFPLSGTKIPKEEQVGEVGGKRSHKLGFEHVSLALPVVCPIDRTCTLWEILA